MRTSCTSEDDRNLPEPFTQRDWALRYLRGRAEAYQRRKVTAQNAVEAVHMALKRNIRLAEIRAILADYGLDWDTERLDLRTNAAQTSMTSTNEPPRPELAEISSISLPPTGAVSLRVKPDRRVQQAPFAGYDRRLMIAKA